MKSCPFFKISQWLICIVSCVVASVAVAQEPASVSLNNSQPPSFNWGIEADVLVPWIPTVHIFTVLATRTLWGDPEGLRGDLVLGVYLRPNVAHDIVDEIDEYLGTIAYRQYVWAGLHLEAQLDLGYAWGTRNKVDGLDHNNFAMLGELHAGYRFDFGLSEHWGLYLNPQVGVIHGLITDIGPRAGKSDTFFSARINVGAMF